MDVGSAGILPSAAYEIFLWTASSSALVLPPTFPSSWLLAPPPPFPSPYQKGQLAGCSTGPWLVCGGGGKDGDELSMGSHLAPSFYSWGRGLLPLLDGGKSTGTHSGQGGKLWRPLGIGGKSW